MNSLLKTYLDHKSLVYRAYVFAKEAHQNDLRASGDPYFTHSVQVAETILKWKLDEASIATALLHDVVEDTEYSLKDLEKKFGEEVAFLVDGLTKLKNINYTEKQSEIENLRKFVLSFTKDLRVVIIKLADRLHNMQTLSFLSEDRQKRMAWETVEIYAPLAYRLGMQKLSGDLEDLAFPYIHPEEYAWLLETIKNSYEDRKTYSEKTKPVVTKLLSKHGIKPISIDARAKRYSSLYKKLMRYDMDIEKVHDLVALRIIVKTIEDCYTVLGIIHQTWAPLPGKIKDYIARPKSNGYRSLHTTVFCIDNYITEFQIRTKEMHEEAELGIAAHWAYQQERVSKERLKKWTGVKNKRELKWVEQLRNWQKTFTNYDEFVKSLKIDFFKDRIFVITPNNDIIDLPSGATPVDFAYSIHSEIGDQCVGAKVNGKIVSLDYVLNSGDIVEIIIQRGKKPSENWLRFVQTSGARERIKSALGIKAPKKQMVGGKPYLEITITNKDHPGYLKDITTTFGELKINITYLKSETDKRLTFSKIIIHSDIPSKQKLQKLLVQLKKISETQEVRCKTSRS